MGYSRYIWNGFISEIQKIAKESEFAPGIPEKKIHQISIKNKPEIVPFVVQRHDAARAGRHYDLRIADPDTGMAHSWALRHIPSPGEKRLAIQQPTHTIPYMNFEGDIPKGYGAGKVVKHKEGPAEILHSDNNKIKFNLYPGSDTEEYSLIRTNGNKWLILNTTPTVETHPEVPQSKPKYKEIKPEDVDFYDEDKLMMGKLDGAHTSMEFRPGKPIKIYSYRPSERSTGIIQHTFRVPGSLETIGKKKHGETILRGELYAIDPNTNKPADAKDIGGMLNSNVLKSRALQEERGILRPAIFDVVKWKGRDFENMPYKEKLKVLDEMASEYDILELPDYALSSDAKMKLFGSIKLNRNHQTKEGVVQWSMNEPSNPVKTKFKPTYDVVVSGIFQKPASIERGYAGGFEYNMVDGENTFKVGRVGTGFSDKLRKDMFDNPEKYIGMTAAVEALDQYKDSKVLRSPSFKLWHLDKNTPESLLNVILR